MPRHPSIAPSALGLSDRVYSALAGRTTGRAGPVYPLHVGDTWRDPPDAAIDEVRRAPEPRAYNYAPVQGEPVLLEAIRRRAAARHGVELDPACVQVTPGATAGLAAVLAALLEPGDELLLPSPFWPLVRGMTASRGCVPVEVPFYTRVGARGFDAEAALEAAITQRTAAIYVNTPHNPTGRVLREEALAAIARVPPRHDLWILADGAYEELAYAPAPAPLWARPEIAARTVAVQTVSKSHALAGARVGWVHGPPGAMEAIRGVQTFTTYCAARPMQRAAARALEGGDAWLERTRELYRDAGAAAADALGVPAPEAGTFLVLDASPHLAPGEDLPAFLARCLDAGVLVTPGAAIGRDFATWVRLCFTAVPPQELDDALRRLRRVLGR